VASKKLKSAAKSTSSKKNKTRKVSPPQATSSKVGGQKKTASSGQSLKTKTKVLQKPAKPAANAPKPQRALLAAPLRKPGKSTPASVLPKAALAKAPAAKAAPAKAASEKGVVAKTVSAKAAATKAAATKAMATKAIPVNPPLAKAASDKRVLEKPPVAKPPVAKAAAEKGFVAKPLAKAVAAKAGLAKTPVAKVASEKGAVAKPALPKAAVAKPALAEAASAKQALRTKPSGVASGKWAGALASSMATLAEALAEEPSAELADRPEGLDLAMFFGPLPEKPAPKRSELPALMTALNRREMEQVLTVASGRGVAGEGSMKGRLLLHMGLPYLEVVGRDRRELYFLLQGPDQEVLPAYAQHRVSVNGLIRKTHNYGGTVDVRKYSAKSMEPEPAPAPVAAEPKLQFLSPGELQQITTPGMGTGMRGFASVRGILEVSGRDCNLVLGGQGTWQQVTFKMEGKGVESLRPCIGQTLQVTGVLEKETGWSGRILVESHELRAPTLRTVSREGLDICTVKHLEETPSVILEGEQPLLVCLTEVPQHIWTVDIAAAKRLGLREVVSRLQGEEAKEVQKEFFFFPRAPGVVELDFFLSKVVSPQQFDRSLRLHITVLPQEP